jgi:cellulose 1,4-beta-cellobiosidase
MKVNVHRPRASRSVVTALSALLLGLVATLITIGSAHAAAGCKITYSTNDWGGGFTANLGITDLGDPVTSWTLEWDFAGNQQVGQGWSGTFAQSSKHVTVKSLSYNGSLATNASTSLGFNGSYTGTNTAPTTFKLNGTTCDGTAGSTPTPTPTPTDPGDGGSHAANPFAGGKGYVNPEWSAEAKGDGGTAVANQPTAVWLDRIAAINGVNGGMGLKAHLDAAVKQAAGQPLTIELVIYDLPGRDCAALASNGELGPTEIGRYQTDYIDPITALEGNSAYAGLRIVNIIEPDSLPNLTTNAGGTAGSTDACATMKANGNYEKGVSYALAKLGGLSNTYNYIDAGHHAWLGWDTNLGPAAQEFYKVATTNGAVVGDVQGFIVNTANYGATVEPYVKITDNVNGTTVRQSKWIDWNYYVDEQSYAQGLRDKLVSLGFKSDIGMLIDTSRNGWGGSARPTGPGATTSVDTYVNGGRIDRRFHAGNWCNQSGAGIGARPTAAPATSIDAYVWIKPPGQSDGASKAIPNDQGKGFDQMCDPTYTGNARNGFNMSGALPDAPLAGDWFSAQFHQLLANAYPPLS